MTKKKILSVIGQYEAMFQKAGIEKRRIDPDKRWTDCSKEELLSHAHYLLDGLKEYSAQSGKTGKTGRHLGSVQTILMICGWQTLNDSMDHNKPA